MPTNEDSLGLELIQEIMGINLDYNKLLIPILPLTNYENGQGDTWVLYEMQRR